MSRLIAVSWAAPPYIYPRAIQIGRSLSSLSGFGWKCTLIAADLAGTRGGAVRDTKLAQRYLSAVETLRVPVGGIGAAGALIRKILGRKLPVADDALLWRQGAMDAARKHLGSNGADVLVTFAQPWSDHLIGLDLKGQTNLPWVAHFSDPWVDSAYYASQPEDVLERWRGQERDIVEAADAIVFTNAETRETVMAKYPGGWIAKAHVLAHSFDPVDELPFKPSENDVPHLLYTGQLYGHRSPRPLFEAMRSLADLAPELPCPRVTIVGAEPQTVMTAAHECGIGDRVRAVGRMTPTALRSLAKGMDGVLVIDAPASRNMFLPSKLFDYLPWNRFVVGLTGKGGATAGILADLGFPFAPSDDVPAIADMLRDICRTWVRTGALTLPQGFDAAKSKFTMARIGERFAAILSQVAAVKKPG